ncbi:unnamed protein product [Pieris brassicae]|uniref:Reverse transcriptase domain-containing protein n=1 Tax=Pieris brassicae TaxID=7116 RepID=A0A9P0X0N1_PIEBR|nr:unnamed protein product [Pieris brassicae]
MEKAFDRVWHAGLLEKVKTLELPRRLRALICSYLRSRSFFVSVEVARSSQRPIAAGVPQGSCLAPTLYSIYTDDIPATGGASRALDALPQWLDDWRLAVNANKTQAISFPPGKKPPPLQLLGVEIPWSTEAKYLGIKLDRGLRFNAHINKSTGCAKAAAARLRPLFSSTMPTQRKVALYKSYVRPHLTNAVELATQNQQDILLKYIVSQLEGRAETACCVKEFENWHQLEEFLKSQFGDKKHYAALLSDLQECRQLGNETVNQFALRIESCLSKLLSEINITIPTKKKDELAGRVAAMKDLHNQARFRPSHSSYPPNRSALQHGTNNNTTSAAFRPSNPIVCRYCKAPGHTIEGCRKREYNNRKFGNNQNSSYNRTNPSTSIQNGNQPIHAIASYEDYGVDETDNPLNE